MTYSFPGDRPPESGDIPRSGRTLPPWHGPRTSQCVVRDGERYCFCGECPPLVEAPDRPDLVPGDTPGWTAQD